MAEPITIGGAILAIILGICVIAFPKFLRWFVGAWLIISGILAFF